MLNIYSDIVPIDYHIYLVNSLLDNKFPWNFWTKAIPDCLKKTNKVEDSTKYTNPTQLKHVFKSKYTETEYFKIIEPLIGFYTKASNTKVLRVHAAAAIMQHPVNTLKTIEPHVDFDRKEFDDSDLVTLVYYVTKANGGTTLYNEFCTNSITKEVTEYSFIPTIPGTMIAFNSNRFHSGVEPTDDIRVLVTIILEVTNADN